MPLRLIITRLWFFNSSLGAIGFLLSRIASVLGWISLAYYNFKLRDENPVQIKDDSLELLNSFFVYAYISAVFTSMVGIGIVGERFLTGNSQIFFALGDLFTMFNEVRQVSKPGDEILTKSCR